jgi:hypothetical protein
MSGEYAALRARRKRLVARSAEQRDDIAREVVALKEAADRGQQWLAGLKRSAPALGAGLGLGLAALALTRPRSSSFKPALSVISRVLRVGYAIWRFSRWLG